MLVRILIVALLCVGTASAESVWQRVKSGTSAQQRTLRKAVQRAADGGGDELDLFRVRAALVSLSRGELGDASTIVTLMGLRRELGLSPGEQSTASLRRALEKRLEPLEHAQGHEELAHILVKEGRPGQALIEIHRALPWAWTVNSRARLLNLKAWILIGEGRFLEAQQALEAVGALNPPRRILLQHQVARALVASGRGRAAGFFEEARRADRLASRRAAVSDRGIFWDLSLSDELQRAGQASLSWGQVIGLRRVGDAAEAEALRLKLCEPEERERAGALLVDSECDREDGPVEP